MRALNYNRLNPAVNKNVRIRKRLILGILKIINKNWLRIIIKSKREESKKEYKLTLKLKFPIHKDQKKAIT